jgi:hypothetical protein
LVRDLEPEHAQDRHRQLSLAEGAQPARERKPCGRRGARVRHGAEKLLELGDRLGGEARGEQRVRLAERGGPGDGEVADAPRLREEARRVRRVARREQRLGAREGEVGPRRDGSAEGDLERLCRAYRVLPRQERDSERRARTRRGEAAGPCSEGAP